MPQSAKEHSNKLLYTGTEWLILKQKRGPGIIPPWLIWVLWRFRDKIYIPNFRVWYCLFIYSSTKVECAGLCLSTDNCYAFDWSDEQCKMLSPPSSTFDVSTGEGMMTICLDHGNWNNLEVYRDNAITPPMCPGKYILLSEF